MNSIRNIKLVTFAPHPNFGTCLQSYALNYVLRKMGYDVEFIYNRRENPPQKIIDNIGRLVKRFVVKILPNALIEKLRKAGNEENNNGEIEPYILELPNHNFLKKIKKIPGYKICAKKWYYNNLQKRKVYKFTFCDGNFKMRRLFTKNDYFQVENDADLFITGSDQIWNPYCGGYNPMMFLEFVDDGTKCIAYSSSISLTKLPPCVATRMQKALQKFSHIAVREKHSVDLLNSLLKRNDIKQVVDPTFLLTAEEWEKFGNRAKIEFQLPNKYIFCYFVGSDRADVYERMVQEVKVFTGITKVITLDCYNRTRIYGNGFVYRDAGPYEWVYLLKNASYICMDSFHATVFALKFQKEFVHVMKNLDTEIDSQNTRMYDMLSRYGILYKNYTDEGNVSWQKTINYKKINLIIEKEIEDSLNYLKFEIEQ